jgi:hypothetical protein
MQQSYAKKALQKHVMSVYDLCMPLSGQMKEISRGKNRKEKVHCYHIYNLALTNIPFPLLECFYVQKAPIHVYQIYHSKPYHFRSSVIKYLQQKIVRNPTRKVD